MTYVRGKRGRLVHIMTPHGRRRDLAPEDIPQLVCGKKMRGAIITDDYPTCEACIEIEMLGN